MKYIEIFIVSSYRVSAVFVAVTVGEEAAKHAVLHVENGQVLEVLEKKCYLNPLLQDPIQYSKKKHTCIYTHNVLHVDNGSMLEVWAQIITEHIQCQITCSIHQRNNHVNSKWASAESLATDANKIHCIHQKPYHVRQRNIYTYTQN